MNTYGHHPPVPTLPFEKAHSAGIEVELKFTCGTKSGNGISCLQSLSCRIEEKESDGIKLICAVTAPTECVVFDPSKVVEVSLYARPRKQPKPHSASSADEGAIHTKRKTCKTVRNVMAARRRRLVRAKARQSIHDVSHDVRCGNSSISMSTMIGPGVQLWFAKNSTFEAELRAVCIPLSDAVGDRLREFVEHRERVAEISRFISRQSELIKQTASALNKLVREQEETEREYKTKKNEVDRCYSRLREVPVEVYPTLETDQFFV